MWGRQSPDACPISPPMFKPIPQALTVGLFLSLVPGWKAQATSSPASTASASVQKGVSLARSGHCSEALPLLEKFAPRLLDKELKRDAGLATVRCAMTLDHRGTATAALAWLSRDFPNDPEVLYVSTHAYSDLSTRVAAELAERAPQSSQAHELNAESLEMQGKWDQAAKEYERVLQQNPNAPGIHFRLGRLLLSKPNPAPDMAEQAKKEFEAELQIDPQNAGAEFILGELARREQQWGNAIKHFSRAAQLDAGFGDAFLGLGQSLISAQKYADAIAPLEKAVKLEPQNPAAHYMLATAYSRAGHKSEAEKEFAVHRRMVQKAPSGQDSSQ
jgi:Tfp pilus assembly protein PilF